VLLDPDGHRPTPPTSATPEAFARAILGENF
jgi:hypothetical protein